VREPFAIDPGAEIVSLVRSAAGGAPVTGASYWADAALIAAAGIPTVMYGPGGEGAHAAVEWVSIADTETVAQTLVEVAARLCA
jgi:acetylornithine deacetylase